MYDISLSYMMYLPVSHSIMLTIILHSAFCVLQNTPADRWVPLSNNDSDGDDNNNNHNDSDDNNINDDEKTCYTSTANYSSCQFRNKQYVKV